MAKTEAQKAAAAEKRAAAAAAKAAETAATAAGLVHLYPIIPLGLSTVPGVPAIEMDVDPERAAELLAYDPPAFTTKTDGSATDEQNDRAAAYHAGAWSSPVEPDDDETKEPEA